MDAWSCLFNQEKRFPRHYQKLLAQVDPDPTARVERVLTKDTERRGLGVHVGFLSSWQACKSKN